MKKHMIVMITAMLVLICLIFFVVKGDTGNAVYDGILVENDNGGRVL